MLILKKKIRYHIRIVYKSGYIHNFWTRKCDMRRNADGSLAEISWDSIDDANRPILIGINEIASVWQVGYTIRYWFW